MKKSVFMQMFEGTRTNEGSFNVSLYKCFLKADAQNKFKLLCAFPDFFDLTDYSYFVGKLSEETIKRYERNVSVL